MNRIAAVKGMNDLLEDELSLWRTIETSAAKTFGLYGYGEIRTPILEELALFVRGVGEGTDIVEKEMYTLEDRDGKPLCLRPEGTAGVVRALIETGKLIPDSDNKVYYVGPMFRRERPQRGRLRQFHQIGVESFGVAEPSMDVEVIAMLHHFRNSLGLNNLTLQINSLGTSEEKAVFSGALKTYFSEFKDELCADCQRRLETNPLRILDCKQERCKALTLNAPVLSNYLQDESREHFDAIIQNLKQLGIPFEINPRLVRGLDYYTRTVFEMVATTGLGAQNTVAAGGRYDKLVEHLDGPRMPAVGFAAGIERLAILLSEIKKPASSFAPVLSLVAADTEGRTKAGELAYHLRLGGLAVDIEHRSRSVKAQMRRADRTASRYVLVLGGQEVEKNHGQLKRMRDGKVFEASLDPLDLSQAITSAELE